MYTRSFILDCEHSRNGELVSSNCSTLITISWEASFVPVETLSQQKDHFPTRFSPEPTLFPAHPVRIIRSRWRTQFLLLCISIWINSESICRDFPGAIAVSISRNALEKKRQEQRDDRTTDIDREEWGERMENIFCMPAMPFEKYSITTNGLTFPKPFGRFMWGLKLCWFEVDQLNSRSLFGWLVDSSRCHWIFH